MFKSRSKSWRNFRRCLSDAEHQRYSGPLVQKSYGSNQFYPSSVCISLLCMQLGGLQIPSDTCDGCKDDNQFKNQYVLLRTITVGNAIPTGRGAGQAKSHCGEGAGMSVRSPWLFILPTNQPKLLTHVSNGARKAVLDDDIGKSSFLFV